MESCLKYKVGVLSQKILVNPLSNSENLDYVLKTRVPSAKVIALCIACYAGAPLPILRSK